MTRLDWREVMPPEDGRIYAQAGYGKRGAVDGNLAVIVVDMTYAFAGPVDEPIEQSVIHHPQSCGHEAWSAIKNTTRLLSAARSAERPIIYTTNVIESSSDASAWGRKQDRAEEQALDAGRIVDEVGPLPGEPVIQKGRPSAFHASPLLSVLVPLGVTSILICGGTTSGCVRATVVDAFSYGYGVSVVEECVFDRAQLSGAVSLYEMNQKYADVLSLKEAIQVLVGGSGGPAEPRYGIRKGEADGPHP